MTRNSNAAALSAREFADMRRIDRLALRRMATRAQLLRGMTLHRKHDEAYREERGRRAEG